MTHGPRGVAPLMDGALCRKYFHGQLFGEGERFVRLVFVGAKRVSDDEARLWIVLDGKRDRFDVRDTGVHPSG